MYISGTSEDVHSVAAGRLFAPAGKVKERRMIDVLRFFTCWDEHCHKSSVWWCVDFCVFFFFFPFSCICQWGQVLLGIWFETVYLGVFFSVCFSLQNLVLFLSVDIAVHVIIFLWVGGRGYLSGIHWFYLSISYCPKMRMSVWLALPPPPPPPPSLSPRKWRFEWATFMFLKS